MKFTNLLFDLDGTLTDPALGITRCYLHAFAALGRDAPQTDALLRLIGPPMRQGFRELLDTCDPALVERAVSLYRERYARAGLFENEVYPGVEAMLADLRGAGFRLFVATSKLARFVAPILEHFRLAEFFSGLYGSAPDASLDDKADILAHLVAAERLDPSATLMIGDREHDVFAARRNRIAALGVTYGYGARPELVAAGADFICDTPAEVAALILARA
jgi:phosphoglycolate phosphatase